MIISLYASSSNRDFAVFSSRKQEKILAMLIIRLLVQIFSLMYNCFILVLGSNKTCYCHLFCNNFLTLPKPGDSQGYYCQPESGAYLETLQMCRDG